MEWRTICKGFMHILQSAVAVTNAADYTKSKGFASTANPFYAGIFLEMITPQLQQHV